jgi:hypothetical protein
MDMSADNKIHSRSVTPTLPSMQSGQQNITYPAPRNMVPLNLDDSQKKPQFIEVFVEEEEEEKKTMVCLPPPIVPQRPQHQQQQLAQTTPEEKKSLSPMAIVAPTTPPPPPKFSSNEEAIASQIKTTTVISLLLTFCIIIFFGICTWVVRSWFSLFGFFIILVYYIALAGQEVYSVCRIRYSPFDLKDVDGNSLEKQPAFLQNDDYYRFIMNWYEILIYIIEYNVLVTTLSCLAYFGQTTQGGGENAIIDIINSKSIDGQASFIGSLVLIGLVNFSIFVHIRRARHAHYEYIRQNYSLNNSQNQA